MKKEKTSLSQSQQEQRKMKRATHLTFSLLIFVALIYFTFVVFLSALKTFEIEDYVEFGMISTFLFFLLITTEL